jgi:hypothetical protein
MHCDHSWRRWLTLPLYFRGYRVRPDKGFQALEEYKFFGGAVRFYVDRMAGYDTQYTLEFFKLIRIDLDVDVVHVVKSVVTVE